MRPEIQEYNFDWMLHRSMHIACNSLKGSKKEYQRMLEYMPYFRGLMDLLAKYDEPGILFLDLVKDIIDDMYFATEKEKKICMTTFCFSPIILHAMDIVPVVMEPLTVLPSILWKRGTYDFMNYCFEVGLSETSCSSQRGALGAYLAGLCNPVDFVVFDSGGVCDTNANAFAFSASLLNKPMYQLDYPASFLDEKTKKYHRKDYQSLIAFLEEQSGHKLDLDRLRKGLEETHKQDLIISQLEELQMLKPNPLPPIFNLFIYAGRFLATSIPGYTRLLESMLNIAQKNADAEKSGLLSGKEKCRAFFCYIDHYAADARLWNFLDQKGITHLGSILSRYFPEHSPYLQGAAKKTGYQIQTQTLDDMIDTLAEINARSPMVKSIRGPYDTPYMWLEDTLALAELYQADCLIYSGTPGCRNTWGMVKPFARDTEKHGYPTHIMYSDAFDERVESFETTSLRLAEFFNVRRLL
ncbi:MAG: 2-hydroxyacyl-CoA dehydratase [Candidatus Magnetomorum sp.]|nr:2-hydroxyacyl-CoA dehydratase [Candidatus Magnetomorum sp.]